MANRSELKRLMANRWWNVQKAHKTLFQLHVGLVKRVKELQNLAFDITYSRVAQGHESLRLSNSPVFGASDSWRRGVLRVVLRSEAHK